MPTSPDAAISVCLDVVQALCVCERDRVYMCIWKTASGSPSLSPSSSVQLPEPEGSLRPEHSEVSRFLHICGSLHS